MFQRLFYRVRIRRPLAKTLNGRIRIEVVKLWDYTARVDNTNIIINNLFTGIRDKEADKIVLVFRAALYPMGELVTNRSL